MTELDSQMNLYRSNLTRYRSDQTPPVADSPRQRYQTIGNLSARRPLFGACQIGACLLGFHLLTFFSTEVWGQPGSWAFEPPRDDFRDEALLDLRSLNESRSGETGFITLSPDGNDFVRGDGKPIRFWAVGSEVYKRSPEEMDRHCRFLAKLGVNLVRIHATVAATSEGSRIDDVNEEVIDGIFRFVKAARDNGIYLCISPYYGHHKTPRSWNLEGFEKNESPWGALFIDVRMQEAYRNWTRQLYARVNPYTGKPICDDPTVAILQVHNEDSLFFWTFQRIPEVQRSRLEEKYAKFLVEKYGSLNAAIRVWGGTQRNGDDTEAGKVVLLDTYQTTQDHDGPLAIRMRDQIEFMATFQRQFYRAMGDYLKQDLGCKQLLNATNWRTANDLKLKGLERWSYYALDIGAENEYYGGDYQHIGENHGYRIDPDHYLVNESALKKPLELTTNYVLEEGHPFIVTETSWKHPNLFQSEGPFLISAYQSLTGLDAVFWFTATDETWMLDPRYKFWWVREMHPIHKWTCSVPMLMGMFPAASLIFREGYLKQGEPVVVEHRSLQQLWNREPPIIDDNETHYPNPDSVELASGQNQHGGLVPRSAFLVGPIIRKLGGNPDLTHLSDLGSYINREDSTIRSNTAEIQLNYQFGLCTINAPKAQGVTGFLKDSGGQFELDDVTINSSNSYASISVVSLDGSDLDESKNILIQVGTTARLSGWKTKQTDVPFKSGSIRGEQIVDTGKPPWMIADTEASVEILNLNVSEAIQLDAAGYPVGPLEVKRIGDRFQFELPADALYIIVR